MTDRAATLVLGWGNPGRQDDGLGPAFVEALRRRPPSGVEVDSDYQLTVEDAAEVARRRRVVFVDADRTAPAPFRWQRVRAARHRASFSTHSVSPGAVLSLSRELFGAEPEAWLLGIRGHRFDEFGEELSPPARANLREAVRFFRKAVAEGRFRETTDCAAAPDGAAARARG